MPQATNNLEWYDPAAVTTADGALVITFSEVFNHNLNFQGGESCARRFPSFSGTERPNRPNFHLVGRNVIRDRHRPEHALGTSSVLQGESSRLLSNSPTQAMLLACGLHCGQWVTWEEPATAQLSKAW